MARILVIDDDSEFLDMMHLLLERDGSHQTMLVADGAEGLARAMADPPDLAVIDVMMPGITGYEVCRQLRAHPPTATLPIIILTARGQPVDREAAMEAGANAYMTKPVTVAELYETINDLLGKYESVSREPASGAIAMMSLRGGVGVTTLAVNLAVAMAGTGETTCIVDLCPSSGHVGLHLRMRPDPNWLGLAEAGNVDVEAVNAHLLQHRSGLWVLASPVVPVVEPRTLLDVAGLLDVLQLQCRVTVIDVPSTLDETVMAALDAADVVGLVITAESPSVQTAIATLRALSHWSAKFQVILNQVTPAPHPPAEAIERALKRPLAATIPFDRDQARALVQGDPQAMSNPDSPMVRAVQEWMQKLAWVMAP
jgi:pilus assembly protein CpaE